MDGKSEMLIESVQNILLLEYTYTLILAEYTYMLKSSGKRIKGVSVDWDELKKRRNINLTDTAWQLLEEKGNAEGISRSEVIERVVRGTLTW